jgi:hypothetical protein
VTARVGVNEQRFGWKHEKEGGLQVRISKSVLCKGDKSYQKNDFICLPKLCQSQGSNQLIRRIEMI